LLDVFLPDIKGLDLRRLIRKWGSTVPVILMTAYPIEMVAVDQVELGLGLIQKPFDCKQLLEQMLRFMRNAPIPEPPGEPIIYQSGITIKRLSHTIHVDRDRSVGVPESHAAKLKPREKKGRTQYASRQPKCGK
jgi:DNA-binding response OmpR family regulator